MNNGFARVIPALGRVAHFFRSLSATATQAPARRGRIHFAYTCSRKHATRYYRFVWAVPQPRGVLYPGPVNNSRTFWLSGHLHRPWWTSGFSWEDEDSRTSALMPKFPLVLGRSHRSVPSILFGRKCWSHIPWTSRWGHFQELHQSYLHFSSPHHFYSSLF